MKCKMININTNFHHFRCLIYTFQIDMFWNIVHIWNAKRSNRVRNFCCNLYFCKLFNQVSFSWKSGARVAIRWIDTIQTFYTHATNEKFRITSIALEKSNRFVVANYLEINIAGTNSDSVQFSYNWRSHSIFNSILSLSLKNLSCLYNVPSNAEEVQKNLEYCWKFWVPKYLNNY